MGELVDQLVEEADGRVELLAAEADGATQDAPQHVAAPLARGHGAWLGLGLG